MFYLFHDPVVDVALQGITRDFTPTGSYDSIELGKMKLSEALELLARFPRKYPEKILGMDEYCPMNLGLQRGDVVVNISVTEEGEFFVFVMIGDKPETHEHYAKTIEEVARIAEKYLK